MTYALPGVTDAPPIILSATDRDRLLDLAQAALHRMPDVAPLLLDEADRATIVTEDARPRSVVGLHSYVEYRDSECDAVQRVQIVYPHEANISEWRISVLTLIGAGLIGLGEGQSILWPTRDGRRRTLSVLKVSAAPLRGMTRGKS
jgi:regulator of nucleoside diphosphate kinase